MRSFNVYRHPAEGYEAVKIGFSWPALVLGIIWMLAKKLWTFAAIWFAAYVLLYLVEGATVLAGSESGPHALISLILPPAWVAFLLIPGFKGNAWRERSLQDRGYELIDTVQSATARSAIARLAQSM